MKELEKIGGVSCNYKNYSLKFMEKKICKRCKKAIPKEDEYCKFCGANQTGKQGFWYSEFGIILFAVMLGPLSIISLINLIRSNRISKNKKIIIGAFVVIVTILFVLITYFSMKIILSYYQQAFNILEI